MYSREIVYIVLVGQVFGLVQNFNIGIFSGTINAINVKLGIMVLFTELYLFLPLSLTLTVFMVTAMSNSFK